MKLFELRCKSCGAQLDIDFSTIKNGIIECSHCGAIYGTEHNPQVTTPPIRPRVPMPKGIKVNSNNGLTITKKWLSTSTFILLFFTLFWNGFLVVWAGIALSTGAFEMLLFSTIHVLVGIFLTYKVIADFFNTTTIHIKFGEVILNHGPLPWPGRTQIPSGNLTQLYCRKRVNRSRDSTSVAYSIHWIDRDNKTHSLLKGLKNPDQALFIEQEIETYMGIQDRPVDGGFV